VFPANRAEDSLFARFGKSGYKRLTLHINFGRRLICDGLYCLEFPVFFPGEQGIEAGDWFVCACGGLRGDELIESLDLEIEQNEIVLMVDAVLAG
jgi:hypothetical protein